MNIQEIINKVSSQIDQTEKGMVPRKSSKLKDLRIVDSKTLIIQNFPLEAKNFHKLYEYPLLGQFQNVKSVRPFNWDEPDKLNTVIEFSCEISASLSFFSIMCLKLKDQSVDIFFKEYTVCLNKQQECECGREYHADNRPEKAYFYKKQFQKQPQKSEMSKIAKFRLHKVEKLQKQAGHLKEFGKFFNENLDFLMTKESVDLEYHIKLAYSILESSKLKIKTNYLNKFALQETIMPDIIETFKTFDLFNHLLEIFISVLKPSDKEIIDEFHEINEQINQKVFENTKDNSTENSFDSSKQLQKIIQNKNEFSKQIVDFLDNNETKKDEQNNAQLQKCFVNIIPEKKYLYTQNYSGQLTQFFQQHRILYKNTNSESSLVLSEYDSQEDEDQDVVLNYREKNYYYLKKNNKQRKKARKAVQITVLNDTTQISKNKKKKKKKKKKQNNTENSIDQDKVCSASDQPEPQTNNDESQMKDDLIQMDKKIETDDSIVQSKLQLQQQNTIKEGKIVESRNASMKSSKSKFMKRTSPQGAKSLKKVKNYSESKDQQVKITDPKRRERTRRKDNKTLERKLMNKEESQESTPNLLKERNCKLFDQKYQISNEREIIGLSTADAKSKQRKLENTNSKKNKEKQQSREKIFANVSANPNLKEDEEILDKNLIDEIEKKIVENEDVTIVEKKKRKKKKKKKKRKKQSIEMTNHQDGVSKFLKCYQARQELTKSSIKDHDLITKETFIEDKIIYQFHGKDTEFKVSHESCIQNVHGDENFQKIFKIFQQTNGEGTLTLESKNFSEDNQSQTQKSKRTKVIKKNKKKNQSFLKGQENEKKARSFSSLICQDMAFHQERPQLKGLDQQNFQKPTLLFLDNLMDDLDQFNEEQFLIEKDSCTSRLIIFK